MLQTETRKRRQEQCSAYVAKNIQNSQLEWLIECGKIRESIYFKGATGDRYTIYVATRRNKNIIDFHTVFNSYDHGTSFGMHIGTLRGYVLTMSNPGNQSWYGLGYTFKQLMRQGVMSRKRSWKIRYCRSAYFVKLDDKEAGTSGTEFTPWKGMQINIKDGFLVNKPNRYSKSEYKKAKESDKLQRKRNRLANKNNTEALERYRKAGGDTQAARGGWKDGRWQHGTQGAVSTNANGKIDWDMIPMDDMFKHRNATLRSNILEHYGINAVLKTLKYDTVDIAFIDGREYKLLDVLIPNLASGQLQNEKCLYLQMLNPSTGESHFEGVANVGNWNAPREATVKAALAWRDGDRDMLIGDGWENHGKTVEYLKPTKLT